MDLQFHGPQAGSLVIPETACPFPDPPAILHSPPDRYQALSAFKGLVTRMTALRKVITVLSSQQLPFSQQGTGPDALVYSLVVYWSSWMLVLGA